MFDEAPVESVEAPVESAEPAPEDAFVSKFASLARKEKALRAKEAEFKAGQEKFQSFDKRVASFKQDPQAVIDFLQENGIDYSSLTEQMLNKMGMGKPVEPIDELRAEIERLKAERDQEKVQAKTEAEKAQEEAQAKATEQFKNNIKQAITDGGEEFELIRELGYEDAVFDTIRAYYEQNQQLLDVKTACEYTEKYLEKQVESYRKINKFKRVLGDEQVEQVKMPWAQQEPRSLSNVQMQANQRPAPKVSQADPLDRDARIKAILARNS